MKIATLFTLLISVAAFAGSGSKREPDRTWITDAIIISPENLDYIEKGSVLIEGGHIARVERTQKTKRPYGAIVVSGNGQYLIPGLMDSHVHLSSIPGMGMIPDQVKLDEPLAKSYAKHGPVPPSKFLVPRFPLRARHVILPPSTYPILRV